MEPAINMHAPLLCFGKVFHARLRPVRHAFGYGVYFLRLPLRAMAMQGPQEAPEARLPARRFFAWNSFNLLSFREADHGDGQQALLPWIDGVLSGAGIDDATGEIWLQAFPRVLGYVFNPVSFWFCHRADGSLRAILCEVNNTFGERHCYLLESGNDLQWGAELRVKKAFHVSPFCSVKGHYRFRFMHRISGMAAEQVSAVIDYHDDDLERVGPLLQTSLAGTAFPLDDRRVLKAFFAYPLMTFGVVLRIHWQALRLWLKRVPFFSKPLPPPSELTR
jgi:uncharacterized protein